MPPVVGNRVYRPVVTPRFGDEPLPEMGVIEKITRGIPAAFRGGRDEQDLMVQAERNADAYRSLLEALSAKGVDIGVDGPLYMDVRTGGSMGVYSTRGTRRIMDRDAIYAAARKHGVKVTGKSRAEYDQAVANRFGARQEDQRVSEAAGFLPTLIGGMGAALTEPVTLATLPVGAGQASLLKTVLIEAGIGAASEVAILPDVAQAFDRMGEDFTAGDMAFRVGAAAAASGALAGAGKVTFDNFDKIAAAPKAVQEKVWAKIVPHLPERLRPKMDWSVAEEHLPEIAEGIIGRGRMTDDEIAVVDGLVRERQMRAASPFEIDGAGDAMHQQSFAVAYNRILSEVPPNPPVRSRPVPRSPSPSRLRGSTAISSGTVAGDARATLKRKIGRHESGGSNSAKNPRSSATGLYQFLDGTWLAYYKRRYGEGGLSNKQILAKRSNPKVQERLMDDLLDDNEAYLRKNGISITSGNLYLAHFAGPVGARKLHEAAPSAPVAKVLGQGVVKANPHLRGMTAADVIAWAHRVMGQKAPDGPTPQVRGDVDDAAALQAEIDRLENERLRLADELDEGDDVSDIVRRALDEDHAAVPVEADPIDLPDPVSRETTESVPQETIDVPQATATARDAGEPAEVQIALDKVEQIVRNTKRSLNKDRDELAEQLDLTRAELDDALARLEGVGAVRKNDKGDYFRRPQDPVKRSGPKGPDDLLRLVARKGGLRDDEGHDLGGLFEIERVARSPKETKDSWKKGVDTTKRRVRGGKLIPGFGPVVRPDGMSVDRLGEILWDEGWFPERPDEDTVMNLLTRASMGEKIYAPEDGVAAIREQTEEAMMDELREEIDNSAGRVLGRQLSDEEAARVYDIYLDANEMAPADFEDQLDFAIFEMINRESEAAIFDAWTLDKDNIYADILDDHARAFEEADRGASARGDEPEAAEGGSGTEPAGSGGRAGDARPVELEQPGPFPEDRYTDFDDPDGDGARAVADSVEHDVRAAADPFQPEIEGGENWPDAVARLTATGKGMIRGALSHKASGPIDVLWGRADADGKQGFGLAKILNKHPEMIEGLPERLAAMEVISESPNRIRLRNGDEVAVISRDWQGQPRDNWLLTAYSEKPPSGPEYGRGPNDDPDGSPDSGGKQDISGSRSKNNEQGDFAAPTQEQTRIALERQGEGRMKSGKAQKAPGSDGGLFDTNFANREFQLDAEGGAVKAGDLLAALDEEAKMIDDIKGCL